MKINILASGSKGNCTFVGIGNEKILIDTGISPKQVLLRLAETGQNLDMITAVFITHEHSDHVNGLANLYKKFNMPIYLSKGTFRNLSRNILDVIPDNAFNFIEFNQEIKFKGFQILPFMTYHDALEPTGYKVIENDKSLVYMTDTGYFPEHGFNLLRNADVYIIESNHEPDLLLDSDRPWVLKRRILDDKGHLSNEDSAFLMINLLGERTKKIVLAHLSEECNTVEHALSTYQRVFNAHGVPYHEYQIVCANQYTFTEEINL